MIEHWNVMKFRQNIQVFECLTCPPQKKLKYEAPKQQTTPYFLDYTFIVEFWVKLS